MRGKMDGRRDGEREAEEVEDEGRRNRVGEKRERKERQYAAALWRKLGGSKGRIKQGRLCKKGNGEIDARQLAVLAILPG